MSEPTSQNNVYTEFKQESSPIVDISVVVPVFNEADNVQSLCQEIVAVMTTTKRPFEMLFVDDASTDGTAERLSDVHVAAPLRILNHRHNCGQSAAIATGFRHAGGTWVATLDGDGQNDPSDLPRLLAHLLATGADGVTGVRTVRRDNWLKRISSRVGNGFRNWVTGDRISDSGCGIRIVRRACLAEVPVFNGMHRFLPTLLRGQGFRVEELPVKHRPRLHGLSKYGLHNRLWRGLRDCLGVRWYLARAVPGIRVEPTEGRP